MTKRVVTAEDGPTVRVNENYEPSKTSKVYINIKQLKDVILTGKILAIDPSTGSRSSMPGFAWFENGKLIESGEINVDFTDERHEKLYEIARTIREDFSEPDLIIIEYIPPVRYGRGGMNNISIMALQKSIGAILSARKIKYMLEVPAITWRNYKKPDYYKSDVKDAETLGYCAIGIAEFINKTDNEKKIKKAKVNKRINRKVIKSKKQKVKTKKRRVKK